MIFSVGIGGRRCDRCRSAATTASPAEHFRSSIRAKNSATYSRPENQVKALASADLFILSDADSKLLA